MGTQQQHRWCYLRLPRDLNAESTSTPYSCNISTGLWSLWPASRVLVCIWAPDAGSIKSAQLAGWMPHDAADTGLVFWQESRQLYLALIRHGLNRHALKSSRKYYKKVQQKAELSEIGEIADICWPYGESNGLWRNWRASDTNWQLPDTLSGTNAALLTKIAGCTAHPLPRKSGHVRKA